MPDLRKPGYGQLVKTTADMGLQGFINRITKRDTAVYWGSPTPGFSGSLTFAAPVEIQCFWQDSAKTMMSNEGREVVSNASVHVTQDLAQNGMLYHGCLDDLTTEQKSDPRKVINAFEIIRFTKLPALNRAGEYERVAYLSQNKTI